MRLIGLAVVLDVGLVLAPLAVEAQPGEVSSRIGFLSHLSPPLRRFGIKYSRKVSAILVGLRERTSPSSTVLQRAELYAGQYAEV